MHRVLTPMKSRFGIEFRGPDSHAEADGMDQVLAELEGQEGDVYVTDRQRNMTIFDGTVQDVRSSIHAFFACRKKFGGAIPDAPPVAKS